MSNPQPEPPTPSPPQAWPPRPPEIATWPIAWRERWGRRSNELEDQGIAFPASEIQAFGEIAPQVAAEKAAQAVTGIRPQPVIARPPASSAGPVRPQRPGALTLKPR